MAVYRAFGLAMDSSLPLPAPLTDQEAQVHIIYHRNWDVGDTAQRDDWIYPSADRTEIFIDDLAKFTVSNGNEILIKSAPQADEELIRAYIIGTCFCFLLQQRGFVTIHGSCLYKEGETLLICGESGAGKSTLAASFLQKGWKLLTDDLVPVMKKEGIYYVQSSIPYQKQWIQDDDISRFESRIAGEIERDGSRAKYWMDCTDRYMDACTPLTCGIMLTRGTQTLLLKEITGFAKTDLLMKNRFLRWHVPDMETQKLQLKTCIGLSGQMRLFLAERPETGNSVEKIADYLLSEIGKGEKNET